MVRTTSVSGSAMESAAPRSLSGTDTDLVEYLMVAVPELDALGGLAPALADLVASGAIRILDLVCVTRSGPEGAVTVLEFEEVESISSLRHVDGEVGGLLTEHDIETASLGLAVGSSAIVLMVEDSWAGSLSLAARQAGGRVVGGGRIARQRIEAALGETDEESSTTMDGHE